MSKGVYLLGQSKGKLGTIVTYVSKGEQRQRVYTDSGARRGMDASLPARAQRVAFGAASNEWKLYRWVCTRMYRSGKRTNESDYNYFVRINFPYLPYLTKQENEVGINMFIPGTYSKGKLGNIYTSIQLNDTGGEYYVNLLSPSAASLPRIDPDSKYGDYITAMRIAFPLSTKICVLIGKYQQWSEEDPETHLGSTEVQWENVIIDTQRYYSEEEKNQPASKVFDEAFKRLGIKDAYGEGTEVCNNKYLISAKIENSVFKNGGGIFLSFFATNDNANDCYSTIMQPEGASMMEHPLHQWLIAKTQDAMNEACISYGYQSAVMQSDIVEVGSAIDNVIENDARILADRNNIPPENVEKFVSEYTAAVVSRNREAVKKLTSVSYAAVEGEEVGMAEPEKKRERKNTKRE